MPFRAPPPSAAWLHEVVRSGFEVVYFEPVDDGYLLTGCTTAVEDRFAWVVDYQIRVDAGWITHSARVTGRSSTGVRTVAMETDGEGHWRVEGCPAPHLDGCLDVDLESSAMTNALPVRRLVLDPGQRAAAPAAYVRALDMSVERLEQGYARTPDDAQQHYDYTAPAFGFACRLVYDESGLLLRYPGIAIRAA